jgi:hypothetical protein
MKRFLLAILSLIAVDFSNAEEQFFCVENVEVKQSDKNALIAKQKALSKALRMAFSRLLSEELGVQENSVTSSISENQISNCICDYSIEREKHSESIYIGKITYRFSKKQVASLLKKYNLKCVAIDDNKSIHNIRVAVYTKDFIDNFDKMKEFDYFVEKFSGKKVVFLMRNGTVNDFRKLGIRYAIL